MPSRNVPAGTYQCVDRFYGQMQVGYRAVATSVLQVIDDDNRLSLATDG